MGVPGPRHWPPEADQVLAGETKNAAPLLPGEPEPLTEERDPGEAWRRHAAPVSRATRRPYIIHCQMGRLCSGGSLCAWHFADCSSHVASLHLHGFAGCDPSPASPFYPGRMLSSEDGATVQVTQHLRGQTGPPVTASVWRRYGPGNGVGAEETYPRQGRQRTG